MNQCYISYYTHQTVLPCMLHFVLHTSDSLALYVTVCNPWIALYVTFRITHIRQSCPVCYISYYTHQTVLPCMLQFVIHGLPCMLHFVLHTSDSLALYVTFRITHIRQSCPVCYISYYTHQTVLPCMLHFILHTSDSLALYVTFHITHIRQSCPVCYISYYTHQTVLPCMLHFVLHTSDSLALYVTFRITHIRQSCHGLPCMLQFVIHGLPCMLHFVLHTSDCLALYVTVCNPRIALYVTFRITHIRQSCPVCYSL